MLKKAEGRRYFYCKHTRVRLLSRQRTNLNHYNHFWKYLAVLNSNSDVHNGGLWLPGNIRVCSGPLAKHSKPASSLWRRPKGGESLLTSQVKVLSGGQAHLWWQCPGARISTLVLAQLRKWRCSRLNLWMRSRAACGSSTQITWGFKDSSTFESRVSPVATHHLPSYLQADKARAYLRAHYHLLKLCSLLQCLIS